MSKHIIGTCSICIIVFLLLSVFLAFPAQAGNTPEEALRTLSEYKVIVNEQRFSTRVDICEARYREALYYNTWGVFWDCYLNTIGITTNEQRSKWREMRKVIP